MEVRALQSFAFSCFPSKHREIIDGRAAGHLGAAYLDAANGLKTSSIHVCICPHFGM